MVLKFLSRVFGSRNERLLRKYWTLASRINSLESKFQNVTDAELKTSTNDFRNRLDNGESIDSLLPDAFAVVREVSNRVLNMRHFDVQLLGGIALHNGKIA